MDFGLNWLTIAAVSGVLTAISFFAIFLAIAIVALRRESVKHRTSLAIFGLFILFAAFNQVLGLTGAPQLQSWWNVTTSILSLLAAIVTIINLPQLLRMPKIAKELRGQAGFLEEQQALLQAIQDSVSDGIMLIDEDGQIKAFNAAALRILWGRNEHQSKPLPEMKELAIRALVQGQSDQEVVLWEGRLIERFTTNVPGYGKLYVFRDITLRRNLESERLRLERVIASMKEGFAIVSVDTMRIVSTNPAMEQMLGFEKNELVGREFSEIQAGSEEERRHAVETISSIVSRDGFWEGETLNRRKDGAELLAHTTVSLTREGESQYFSFIQVDVTEQNRLRDEKEHLRIKLVEAQRLESVGRLAEGVGHEFNNLLTSIMGNAGMALDLAPPGDPLRGMLEDIIRASERAGAVSRQLLAFSGKSGPFSAHPVDLSGLIEDLAGLAQASISKKVQFQMNLNREIPLVQGDATQIRQVALNLIANGAEAIGEAGGTVKLTTGVEEITAASTRKMVGSERIAPGRYVYLEIEDDGCGMEETSPHIFDPFVSTKSPGRGLGLAAVLGIVRAHGGGIAVDTAPGKGSTFRVLFPAAGTKPLTAVSTEVDRSRGQGTILVVEDEPIVRRTTLAVLSQYGFDVRAAENGQIAVEMFREMAGQISLVLLDVVMPVMGGEETLAQIKQIRPDVPIVICTGHNSVESIERFSHPDVDGIVKKPYTARQLVDTLRTVLDRRALRQDGATR